MADLHGAFGRSFRRRVRPSTHLPPVLAGAVSGLFSIIYAIAFAALLFTGDATRYLSDGVGLALTGTLILSLILPFMMTYRGALAALFPEPAIALGVAASAIAGIAGAASLPTITLMIIITGLVGGAAAFAVGQFRLARFGQFIPFPVVAGFLAGLGVLLVESAIGLVVPGGFSITTLVRSGMLPFLPNAPAIALAVVVGIGLLVLQTMRRTPYAVPAALVVGTGGFWLVALAVGMDMQEAQDAGWLLGPFQSAAFWSPSLVTDAWTLGDATLLANYAPEITIAVLLLVFSAIIDTSGVEHVIEADVDPNRDLRAVGTSNIACGAFGGLTGGLSIANVALAVDMDARGRTTGLAAAGVIAVVFAAGPAVLALLPKFPFAGLLLFVGVEFIREWLIDAARRVSRTDLVIIVAVSLAVAFVGLLEGFVLGIVLGFLLFVISYSRLSIVRFATTGEHKFSNVDRREGDRAFLRDTGQSTMILKLQGYIFFGTARRVVDLVRTRLDDGNQPKLAYLVIDFGLINGADTSAVAALRKIAAYANTNDFELVFVAVPAGVRTLIERHWSDGHALDHVHFFSDLDHGLEWVEAERLEHTDTALAPPDIYADFLGDGDIDRFSAYTREVSFAPGDHLCRQGEPSTDLFIILEGEVSVMLRLADGRQTRLRRFLPGSIVGEVAMFLDTPRSASVIAHTPVRVAVLSREAMERMREENPEVLISFLRGTVRALAGRTQDSNALIRALMD